MKYFICGLTVFLTVASSTLGRCDEILIELRFEDHHFIPQKISAPANQPLKIRVTNTSRETIEFESFKLNREKVIGPGETITVFLPALRPGNYDFYDDFHQDVPEGALVVK